MKSLALWSGRYLVVPFVAVAALLVALWLLLRSRRGSTVMLGPGRSPRLLRMVAVLLVLLAPSDAELNADGQERAAPVAPLIPGEWPTGVSEATVARWRRSVSWTGPWRQLKRAYVRAMLPGADARLLAAARQLAGAFPASIGELVVADIDARARGTAMPAHDATRLLGGLDALESEAFFDPWAAAYLWRASARAPRDGRRIELYQRLRRHLRIGLTLIRAQADARAPAFEPRAWMSKAGPSREERQREEAAVRAIFASARRLYAAQDAGPWDRECLVGCRLAEPSGGAMFVGSGAPRSVAPGASLRLGRLDVLVGGERGATLEHAYYGSFEVSTGGAVTAWELGDEPSPGARARIDLDVASALAGDTLAAQRLEAAFAFVRRGVRAGVTAHPSAPGAPLLRTITALFDDAVLDSR